MTWPALIFSTDLLPDQGRLNGRRWSSQLLLRLWLKATQNEGLDLLAADPQVLDFLRSSVDEPYRNHRFWFCSITDPKSLSANGALFIPDPSLGAWASWRQAAGHHNEELRRFAKVTQDPTLEPHLLQARHLPPKPQPRAERCWTGACAAIPQSTEERANHCPPTCEAAKQQA